MESNRKCDLSLSYFLWLDTVFTETIFWQAMLSRAFPWYTCLQCIKMNGFQLIFYLYEIVISFIIESMDVEKIAEAAQGFKANWW